MTGTFKTKTRVYTSPQFVTPIVGRKSFVDAAVDFRRSLIENSSMAVLDADIAVKAAMGAGLSSSQSVGQTAQGTSPDSDGKKRVNKGGVPGMVEDEMGYRYIPEATWGPDKVLKLFPSTEERQSSNKVPNFGFVDKQPMLTPEQFVEKMEQKPKIRMSKYKINTRTGEPIEDTEVEFDRMRFGKTFKLNPDVSDEIDENISDEIQEKSLGSSLKERMPGASIAGRAAARFGVIMDELGKMRCPPGTPAANQFTDMTGSNCFGVTPGNIISQAINLAQRLVPDDDPRRSSGFTRGIANFLFDMENGIFGNNVWYHADGTRMKHGEWRKFREAGGVAKNERWMVNGVERVYAELDAQDARMADLYMKLGVDVSDANKATNEHLYEAFQKLYDSGVINTGIHGKPTPAQVEAMMTARLKNMDAHWIARTDEEKKILLNIEVQRYRELERAHLEAFLDEVIKNPDHMKSIVAIRMMPGGNDRASFGIEGIAEDGTPLSSINIDIPNSMAFQDSMLPNLSPDERLRIWAEGGQSDAVRASAVKDFLVNSNSHAGQMMAMVDGGRGLGRHDMKHEIAHSIQAKAIFEHMKKELDARGSLIFKKKDGTPVTITSFDDLNSDVLADFLTKLMVNEDFLGIDLETLNNLRSRADVVAFLAGKYPEDVRAMYGDKRRATEIAAELWALRSSGLIFGDDVDAALEYMDDVASGKITADRDVADNILTRRIYEEHLDGSRRIREAAEEEARLREYAETAITESERMAEEARTADTPDGEFFDADARAAEARMSAAREAYAQEKRAEVKATKEAAKTMTEDEMVDFLSSSTEASDALTEILDASDDAGEELDWMSVMDRDTLDAQTKAVVDEWVKRFTVRRSPEALDKLQKMIDDKRESRGTLSPQKIEERRHREFLEGATERAKDMDLGELVQHYSDWEELAAGEGLDGPERIRRKAVRDMYRDEYLKRRTEGPDSISKEDARKEFNSKFKELRKPKTVAEREKQSRVKPKKFTSHNGKNGARTFATEERARLLEGATTAEKIAFVEMGSGETDVINMMGGYTEGMAAARAIQRRNTRLKKNGILPDQLNQHEASIEEQVENFYIPLLELMDKSSLSQTVEMHVDRNEDTEGYIADLLNGGSTDFTNGINSGTLVTSSTDFSDGKKIIVRFPEGSKALFPDWSYSSDSDNGEQKIIFPPSKLHLVEVRDDGTVVLEVGEQMGTEAALKGAVREIGAGPRDTDVAYRQGLQKKVSKVVDKRIVQRRRQGMFDPEKSSPIEEERFNTTADTAATGAGFMPDRPPSTPRRFATNDDDIGTGDFDDDLSPDERRWRMEEMRSRGNDRLSSGADTEKLVSISSPQDARRVIDSNLPASVRTEKEAYTILTELAKMAREAKAKGKDAPNYDFCKVSIPGTNLFCGDSKGIPRKKMPQFSGKPTPGSPADSRPKDRDGGVDGTQDFIKHMEGLGVKVEEKEVLASTLRASQNELVGEKVAGMMTNENFDPAGEPIFVSRDGYVIDGHHRWAAQVGRDLEDGNLGDLPLNVKVVDMDILEVLEEANKFAQEFGIAPKTAGNDAAQNRLSSGAKWGAMPSSNEQIAHLLESSNNDGFNEIYGPPQTREERITQMAEMQSEVMTSLREMIDNVPGAGDSLGLDITHIDPVLADFIKNSSDEEIYNLVSESAKNLHESFDSRPRVRMRQDELDRFAASGRYGREESFNTDRLSSGKVKKGIRARAKERAIEMIADRIGKDEDSKEIAEMFLDTVSALKFGPEAALTRLAIDLGRRGSRDVAERTVQELIDRGKITDDQAKSILSKLDKIAPDGLPEPLKRGVGRAARATAEALDTPENRDRLDSAREAVGEAAGRAREAVGEGARNVVERSRERLKKLRERDDAGSLPSSPEDVPFGDFDPADAPVDPFSSGRRLDRRVANSDAGREQIMEGASRTRTRLSSGEAPKTKEPKKPFKPREPDNGPMTGKFIDIFRGVSSYQEMLDRYNEQEVIFFDYETTGLEPNLEKPVQIGAVKMKGGKVVERFNIFVNPGKELSDWSKENLIDADGNPLTDEWLSKQVSIADAHQQLINFFGPDALLGGQYTPFDLGFLEQSLKDSGLEWKPAGVMDSKALADELLPKWTPDGGDGPFMVTDNGTKKASNSLGPLSDYLGVNLTAWHTADADSEASAMIVQKILERAAERNDTPKHLLDVDNLPNIVTERRAKHKLEMDKYDAEMKQYKVDLEEYKSSQTADKQTGGERFSSGETYKKLVREQGRPSEKQREAISDVRDILKNDEFGVADEWTYEDGTIDSPKRAELKEKVAQRITEAFSHDIEAREDIIVVGKNGEEINLGKDFEVVVTEVSVDVQDYDQETLDRIKEEEMYDNLAGSQNTSPSTLISMKIAIKPKDKEAAKRLEEAGIPDLLLPDYYDGKTPADDIQVGRSSRSLTINGDEMHAIHESLFIRDEAKGKGIGSLFNAKNEGVYEELGVQTIFTQGQSSELGESEGGTHWPRNGFTWAGEKSKQDFIKVIDNALRKRKSKFSEEERARISSLYRKNPSTGKFETDASAEELVDFKYADQLFQEKDVEFMFKRDIELASAGGARFSSGESRNTDSSGLIDKEILDKYLQEFSRSDDWMSDTIIPVDGRGRYPIPGVLPKKPDYLPLWDSILPRIEADRKKREAEEAARIVSYAQFLRPHNMGHRIDKPFNEMSDTELKLHMKYIEGSQPQGYPALGLDGWRAEKETVEKELRRRRISPNFTHAQKEEADQIVKDFNYERAEKEARRVAEAIKQSEEMRARLPQPGTPEHARVEELNKQLIELEDRRIKRMNVLRNLENPTDAEKAEYEAISQLDHPYMTAKTPRLVDGYEEWEKFATAREKQKRDVLDGKMGWNEAAKMLEERNRGYADALFPKTKESEFKVGKVKPEKPTRISSGEVKRDLKPGALKADTSELIASDDGYKKKKFTVHQIGDEKIVFGAKIDHGGDFEGIKRVAINPYEISGHGNMSPEGREFAMKWTAAHAAQIAEDEGKSSTKVDALLYAAARGDSEAMKEFELLAAKGERLIEEERKLQSKESLGWERPWQGNPEWKLNEAYDEASKAAIKKEGLEDLSMKDLYLVHETKYDLVEDSDGNLILRPLGDHELEDRDGNPAEYHRDTLHFALNHLAGGHFMRQEQQGNIIVVPLSSVLEQNPDSLDALFAVDTYLVPKPGEPLVLPKGAFKTIPKGSSNPKEETEKALKEMGASHLFEAGDTHSSQGVDGKIRQMASEMGIQSTIHANIPHAWMEQKVSAQEPEYVLTARELAQMSPNARMRIADNDRFSGVKTEVDNTRMFSGENLRSPGLKTNRDRPMSEYGMDWKPEYSDKEWVKPAKSWEGWENVPITEVDLSSEIRPTESHLKGSSIDKVVSGEEAFREGYHPNIVIDKDGKMYVSDGHNRVAMHRALGNEKMTARVIDLRKQEAPWGDKTPNTTETRLSSGEGLRSRKPKRVKKYKGYTLTEPDNPTPKPGEYPDDVVEAATKHRAEIEKVEGEITKLLIDLAEKNKARMEGLDFRLKALKSLMRKIAAEKDSEHGGDAEKAAKAMSDVVRYTMSYEPEDYVAGVKDVVAEMQKLGYDLRIKNYWKGGDPYQGINVAVTHPDGTKFELQFHTPQSVADKDKIHAIYEEYRTSTDPKARWIMYNRMVRMANKIGIPIPPDELMEIGIVKEQPFTPR